MRNARIGVELFVCGFYAMLSTAHLLHTPALALVWGQALLCFSCYLLNLRLILGMSVASILMLSHDWLSGPLPSDSLPLVILLLALWLWLMPMQIIDGLQKLLRYKLALVTASTFSAMLLTFGLGALQSTTLDSQALGAFAFFTLLLTHLWQKDWGIPLVSLLLTLFSSQFIGPNLSWPLNSWQWPAWSQWPTLLAASLSLYLLILVDANSCLEVLTKHFPDLKDHEKQRTLWQRLPALTALNSLLGCGGVSVYFENIILPKDRPNSALAICALCYFILGLTLSFVQLDAALFTGVFMSYLAYRILWAMKPSTQVMVSFWLALLLLQLSIGYLATLACLSMLHHGHGLYQKQLSYTEFLRNVLFWFFTLSVLYLPHFWHNPI